MSTFAAAYTGWAEEEVLSSEVQACLACARSFVDPARVDEFRSALAECTDADRLCETAVGHGMLGHLHRLAARLENGARRSETGAVDPALAAQIADLQRLSAQRNLRQAGYLLRILESLRAAGVETMPFKGPAWAERLYGDVTLRSYVDLDLLVRHEQAVLAREVLLANALADDNRFNERILKQRRRGWGEIAMSAADLGVHADLHWEITVGFSGRSLDAEALFGRAGGLSLLGREILTPSPTDLLLISCLHGTRHRWDRIEELLGVAVQVEATASADWCHVMSAAKKAGCVRRVVVGVAHVCRVFGLAVPPEVIEILDRDRVARSLLRSLRPETLDRGASSGSRRELAVMGWVFATEDSMAAALWHGAVRFFRPGPADWERVTLPSWADWLHYLLRPPRLAIKWLGRVF